MTGIFFSRCCFSGVRMAGLQFCFNSTKQDKVLNKIFMFVRLVAYYIVYISLISNVA